MVRATTADEAVSARSVRRAQVTIKMAFRSIPGAKKYKMEVRSRIAEATLETPPVDPNFAASPNSTDSLSQVSTTPSNALRRASPLRALESADSTSSAAEPPNHVTVAHVGSSHVRERGALTGLAVELTNSSEPGLDLPDDDSQSAQSNATVIGPDRAYVGWAPLLDTFPRPNASTPLEVLPERANTVGRSELQASFKPEGPSFAYRAPPR